MNIADAIHTENDKSRTDLNVRPFESDNYTGFRDFLAYVDVSNWHVQETPAISGGVAAMKLAHNCYGIYDAHTNKGYVIFGDYISGVAPTVYFNKQVSNCRSKYVSIDNNPFNDTLVKAFNQWLKDLGVAAYQGE